MLDNTLAAAVPAPRDDVEQRVGATADALLKWTALAQRYERAAATAEGRARVEALWTAAALARRSLQSLVDAP